MQPHLTPLGKRKSIPILTQHRRVGAVVDHTFHKDRVCGSKHFLRNPPGIALSVESLSAARAVGADEISITDTETDLTYRTTYQTIHDHGFRFDRGFGEQVGLEFQWWSTGKRVDLNIRQLALGL
jgi:hypothetical protein